MQGKEGLLNRLRDGEELGVYDLLRLTLILSVPAILAQISTIAMQYIDAAMVGSLGAQASASIGLVTSTTWVFGGLLTAISMGFSVQIAHHIGAKNGEKARDVVRQSLTTVIIFSLILLIIGVSIARGLPSWLGGDKEIHYDAYMYFLIFSIRLPIMQLRYHTSSMLRCSGNMRVPSIISVLMCVLDVVFNLFLIFKTQSYSLFGVSFTLPGAGLGVIGAALGTFLAELVAVIFLLHFTIFKSNELRLSLDKGLKTFKDYIPSVSVIKKALKIAVPIGLEHVILCSAQIVGTMIVAPLGTVAIAANAFGIIVESLCYMPGFGIADAATTLVGQSLGAKRYDLTKRLGWMTVGTGVVVMSIAGVIMYITAPYVMSIMTNDPAVIELATESLRIECYAEPLYAASIVAYGVFIGATDTFFPAFMNLASIWVVRIPLAYILAPIMGLKGAWLAMAIELSFRGLIFIGRLWQGAWINNFIKRSTISNKEESDISKKEKEVEIS